MDSLLHKHIGTVLGSLFWVGQLQGGLVSMEYRTLVKGVRGDQSSHLLCATIPIRKRISKVHFLIRIRLSSPTVVGSDTRYLFRPSNVPQSVALLVSGENYISFNWWKDNRNCGFLVLSWWRHVLIRDLARFQTVKSFEFNQHPQCTSLVHVLLSKPFRNARSWGWQDETEKHSITIIMMPSKP